MNFIKSKKFLLIIILIEVMLVSSYFSYIYFSEKSKISLELKEIKKLKADIQILKNIESDSLTPNPSDIKTISDNYLNKEFKFGGKYTKVNVLERISKKGFKEQYFKVRLHYKNTNDDAIKKMLVLEYLNPKVFRIIDVKKDYIEIIWEKI